MDRAHRILIIRESITKIAKILTDNKVIVTQSGVKAFVTYDEKTMQATRVNIPMIPDDASDELIDAVQGFLDHEISKVLFADSKSALRAKYEKLAGIHSPIESLFCENEMMQKFPGSRANLDHMHRTFVDRFIEPAYQKALAEGASEEELFRILAVPALRAWGGQKFFQDYMSDKWGRIAGIQSQLDPVAKKIRGIKKPEECFDLAREIRNIVEGEPEAGDGDNPFGDEDPSRDGKGRDKGDGRRRPKMPSAEKEKPEESEEGDGDSSGEGKGDGDEEESEEGAGSGGDAGDAGDDEDEGAGEDGAAAEGESNGDSEADAAEASPPKLSEDGEVSQSEYAGSTIMKNFDWDRTIDIDTEFGNYVTDLCSESFDEESYTVFTRDWDSFEPPKIPRNYDPKWVSDMEDTVQGMVGPIARDLERAFTARNKTLWQQGTRSGRLSTQNLYRLSCGDDQVFKKKIEHKTREVDVSLVIDCSGSMGGSKIQTAMAAAWVMSEVLDKLGVKHEIIGFTTKYHESKDQPLYDEFNRLWSEGKRFDRHEPIYMPVFKSFDERFSIEVKKRMVSLPRVSGVLIQNIDGESVQYAYERLMKRSGKGKMMIVFSDGMPAAGVHSGKLNRHLKTTVKAIEAKGVNIVGVGIMSNSVQSFYRKNVTLNNIADLPGETLKQLREALLAS